MNVLALIDFKSWFPNIDAKVWEEILKAYDGHINNGRNFWFNLLGVLGIALGVTLVVTREGMSLETNLIYLITR